MIECFPFSLALFRSRHANDLAERTAGSQMRLWYKFRVAAERHSDKYALNVPARTPVGTQYCAYLCQIVDVDGRPKHKLVRLRILTLRIRRLW